MLTACECSSDVERVHAVLRGDTVSAVSSFAPSTRGALHRAYLRMGLANEATEQLVEGLLTGDWKARQVHGTIHNTLSAFFMEDAGDKSLADCRQQQKLTSLVLYICALAKADLLVERHCRLVSNIVPSCLEAQHLQTHLMEVLRDAEAQTGKVFDDRQRRAVQVVLEKLTKRWMSTPSNIS
eukprot:SAG11_NODE_3576_length_2359_cov_1.436283_2_plen_182_part_00